MNYIKTTVCAAAFLTQVGIVSAATLSYEETATGTTGSGAVTSYSSLPISDGFFHTLGAASGTLGAPADPGFSFYDDYIFSVSSSSLDAASFVLNLPPNLSIDDLQMRLYTAAGNSTLPVLGNSPAGLLSGWSAGTTTALLSGGTYVLEVRGDVTGTAGGTYSGIIDLQPVPMPAALPLLLSGLGLFSGLARRRG